MAPARDHDIVVLHVGSRRGLGSGHPSMPWPGGPAEEMGSLAFEGLFFPANRFPHNYTFIVSSYRHTHNETERLV
jgi:hypothetical protein